MTDHCGKQVAAGNPFLAQSARHGATPHGDDAAMGARSWPEDRRGSNWLARSNVRDAFLRCTGDNEAADGIGIFGPGAAAVIETGMATQIGWILQLASAFSDCPILLR
jgi:hypothetical protein